MTTTPSAASTAEELRELAGEIMATELRIYLGETAQIAISSALRELAAIKEAAQRQNSAYAQAWRTAIQDLLDDTTIEELNWIERRAVEIVARGEKAT